MPPPKVVLDTNVVVSAHLNPDGLERLVLNLALAGRLRLCISSEILAEYDEVLRRPKFAIDPAKVTDSIRLLSSRAAMLEASANVAVTSDPEDNKFLECAEEAGADYLITGNLRHFPKRWKKTRIVSSRQLIEVVIMGFKGTR